MDPETTTPPSRPGFSPGQWVLLGQALLPVVVFAILNSLRPDVIAFFLSKPAGYWIVRAVATAVVVQLAALAVAFVRINRRFPRGAPGRRRRISLVAVACVVLLNVPAVLAVTLGPVTVVFLAVPNVE